MKHSKSYAFLILAAAIAAAAGILWVSRSREIREQAARGAAPGIEAPEVTGDDEAGVDSVVAETVDLDDPGVVENGSPQVLVEQLAQALSRNDMNAFNELLGGTVDEESVRQLRQFAANHEALGVPLRVREVGETELNRRSRWAIEGGVESSSRMYLDLMRAGDRWAVEKISLPDQPRAVAGADPLAVAEQFMLAVLAQRFEEARGHVDGQMGLDARIAGLCILFEEGEYHLRDQKPLRALFQREEVAGYLANVVAADGSQAAQFALTLVRRDDRWLVSEINLDRLLADYAQRVAGGDVYYSPLVRNPEGGETLALYFGFDEDEISPRSQRQLEVVAAVLKADPVKKLTLSGHTDSKGSDAYNRELSMHRAEVVRDFLIGAGVQADQIVTLAKGASQPRRPNVTETGEDNPQGRKVNRRTEIYLDF